MKIFWSYRAILSVSVYLAPALCFGYAGSYQGSYLEIVLETDGNTFTVVSKRRKLKALSRRYRQSLRPEYLYIESLDSRGQVTQVKSVPDPTVLYYGYLEPALWGQGTGPGSMTLKGGKIKFPKAELVLRIPAGDHKKLRISRQRKSSGLPLGLRPAGESPHALPGAPSGRAMSISADPLSPPPTMPAGLELVPLAIVDIGEK